MKRVKVKRYGFFAYQADLETDDQKNAWIAENIKNNAWGLPERPELDENGEPTGKMLPAEYEIVEEDVTAEVEAEKVKQESKKTRKQVVKNLRGKDLKDMTDAEVRNLLKNIILMITDND